MDGRTNTTIRKGYNKGEITAVDNEKEDAVENHVRLEEIQLKERRGRVGNEERKGERVGSN